MGIRRAVSTLACVCALAACEAAAPVDVPRLAANMAQPLTAATRGAWTEMPLIPAYKVPVMATVNDKLTLFASSDELERTGTLDTWEWYAGAWSRRQPADAPRDRLLPGLARFGDTLVMFGGFGVPDYSETGLLDETWQWKGCRWTQLTLPYGPPPGRFRPGVATLGKRLIMFGGQNDVANIEDTWLFDGQNWLNYSKPLDPVHCASPVATLGNKALIFCAGSDPEDRNGHTYEWNGSAWVEKQTATQPSRRYSHLLARYDDRIVMFGGYADSGNWQETWEWDGTDWHDVTVQPSPPPRDGYQMHQQADELVLFGAGEGQTWTWNGAQWSVAAKASMPLQRRDYAIGTLGDRVFLFGGCCQDSGAGPARYWDDTWSWDGKQWSLLAPAERPPGRTASNLAAVRGKLVLFGGLGADGLLDDTWLFDGVSWREATPITRPAPRQFHAMAAAAGKLYMFGGASTRSPRRDVVLSDFWSWDSSQWQAVPIDAVEGNAPRAPYKPALASFGSQLALFEATLSRLWLWDGTIWTVGSDDGPGLAFGNAQLQLAALKRSAASTSLVVSGSVDQQLVTYEWDGTTWSSASVLDRPSLGRFAARGGTLVGLGGWPLRTWTYIGR